MSNGTSRHDDVAQTKLCNDTDTFIGIVAQSSRLIYIYIYIDSLSVIFGLATK